MRSKILALAFVLSAWLFPRFAAAAEGLTPTHSFAFSGNAYDFLQFLSYSRNCQIAIDPATLEALVKTEMTIATPSSQTAAEILESNLKGGGFVVQELALTSAVRVAFVTTTDGWTYLQAITAMKRGNLPAMYNFLTAIKDDQSTFGAHCAMLKKALVAVNQRNQQMSRLETEVQDNLAGYKQFKAELKMAEMTASRSRNSAPQDTGTALAKSRYEKATADAHKSLDALNELYDKMVESNVIIANAYDAANSARYTSEAAFLFEHLYGSFVRYRSLLGAMQKEGLLKSEKNLDEIPKEIQNLRAGLWETMKAAEADLNTASQALAAHDTERAREFYGRAYWGDRSLPLVRAGIGYCDLQRNAASLRAILDETDPGALALRVDRLEKEFRDQEHLGLLRAMVARRTDQPLPAARPPKTKIGSLNGMAVVRGKGELFPLTVRIDAIASQPIDEKRDDESYWESLTMKEIKKRDYPVSFGDFGQKDLYMFLAATEAYKWLKGVDGALAGRIGLQVEFQELVAGKGGDSAGVTIATGAYSSLRKIPVRQEVAMTGSIHSDGAVTAVGLVNVKVGHAAVAPGVELAIVPEENLADLSLLSIEELCRITIITAKDIRTYLKYATIAGGSESSEQHQADLAIARLHDAQAHLLAGETAPALKILLSLADCPQEIYTVHRLLNLLLAKEMVDGKLADARNLAKQLDEALTKQVLASPVQDFQIPTTTTTLPASLLAEAQRPEVVVPPPSTTRSMPTYNRTMEPAEPPTYLGVLGPQRLAWDALPFPKDSNWSGPRGERAKIESDEITLLGRPVRTHNNYSGPVTLEFDVSLEDRTSSDGSVEVWLIPSSSPADRDLREGLSFGITYPNKAAAAALSINMLTKGQGARKIWGDQAFHLDSKKWYHFKLDIRATRIRITTDDRMFEVQDVTVPLDDFHIQLKSWQPNNQWRIRGLLIR